MATFQILSKSVDNVFPDEWYSIASEDHFWLEWRFRAFLHQLRDLGLALDAPLQGLDIGCGHGILRRQLERKTHWTIDGADLNEEALRTSIATRGTNFYYDIHDRRPHFAHAYDCLFLFDVIEHIEAPREFIDSALFHLRPGGWLFINVPAQEFLRSAYDAVAGHVRRYDRVMMTRELSGHRICIRDLRYWGLTMVPLALLRKLVTSHTRQSPSEILRTGFTPPSAFLHAALKFLMRIETRVVHRPPLGTSLLVAATKLSAHSKASTSPLPIAT